MNLESASDVTVLVVDDEPDVADVYALHLQRRYDVRKAYGGEEALELVDSDVDVVLLDRRMPDRSGDEVLEELRARGLDCRVIMTTGVEPDFDILEMPFDDYLCKPIRSETLFESIDQQVLAATYEENVNEFFTVSAKIGLLEAEKLPQELEDSEEYRALKRQAGELKAELDEVLAGFDDLVTAFESIDRWT